MNTAIRIKKLRELRNYTQDYVADRLRITQNAYSKMGNGLTKITVDRLEEIAGIFEVPVETLVENEKQVFNLDNNQIEKFYGSVENLHEENKDFMQKTFVAITEQLNLAKEQNQALLKALEHLMARQ